MQCLHCQHEHLVKCGLNHSGTQRFQCKACRRYSTLNKRVRAEAEQWAVRRTLGLKMVHEGNSFRAVARILDASPQSVSNWVTAAHARLQVLEQQEQQKKPELPRVAILEADEQWTYVQKKRNKFSCSSPSLD
jgi:transposase-like protein